MCLLDEKLIFILNCGRSGSMSFAKHFGLEHEPDRGNPDINLIKKRAKIKLLDSNYYGETTHFLKDILNKLMEEFPNATYIHLIRNGRDVVKSFAERGLYRTYLNNYPLRNKPLPYSNWSQLTALQKICYYWIYWNERFSEICNSTIRLEDISWMLPKLNSNKKSIDWLDSDEKVFQEICGDLMKQYGYK